MIQKAQNSHLTHVDNIVSKMYQDIKTKREKARQEHIKQETEKAKREIAQMEQERQRKAEAARELARKEVEKKANEQRESELKANSAATNDGTNEQRGNVEVKVSNEQPQVVSNGGIGGSWSEVSPQDAANYMSSKTGVSASTWEGVIFRESSNNPVVTNSIGCFGYLQLHPVHGNVSGMTPQQYLDTAVQIYQSQGASAWEAW